MKKKLLPKVVYFNKIAEIFSSGLAAQKTQTSQSAEAPKAGLGI